MRTFLALPLSGVFEQELAQLLEILPARMEGVRWTELNSIHVTLHFFGETTGDQLAQIRSIIKPLAASLPPLRIGLKGIDFFPDAKAPKIIWAGIVNTDRRLVPLQEKVEQALVRAGFAGEDRPFNPHGTLGRVKGGRRFEAVENLLPATDMRLIDNLALYHSRLTPAGSRYEILETFPLAG